MSAALLFFLCKRDRDLVFVSANIGLLSLCISDYRWGNGFCFKTHSTNGCRDYRSNLFGFHRDEHVG